jgi:hypothetical protein
MQEVVVQLFNGVGNQLFQYAAGRWLAASLGSSLRLVTHHQAMQSQRPLLLQRFAIPTAIKPMSALDRLVVSRRPQYQLSSRAVRRLARIQLLMQDPTKIAMPFDFEVDSSARAIYMSGYFQEYDLVRQIAGLLRRELVLREPLHRRSQEYADRMRSACCPVSIHLRRGDYLTTFGPNGVLPVSYYDRAIDYMQSQFRDASFFVFSDDLAFAKFWARAHRRMTVVDCDDSERAHECLHLMSLCRHHIIANSTFSWWGAWLNDRPDRQVVAPDRWLGLDTSASTVACPAWQLLPACQPMERHAPTPEPVARRA